jgi:hypothetical protein
MTRTSIYFVVFKLNAKCLEIYVEILEKQFRVIKYLNKDKENKFIISEMFLNWKLQKHLS